MCVEIFSEEIEMNSNTTHYLKTWQPFWDDIASGKKTFEIRKHDRDFKIGDILILQEYDHKTEEYCLGNCLPAIITYIVEGGQFGIEKGYCVMGIALPKAKNK